MFIDGQQSDVVVVYDVLRIFKAIVGIQEVIECRRLLKSELFAEYDVEDLCRPFVVVRQASLTQFMSCAVELPVDMLYGDEHQPQQLVQNRHHKTLSQQPISR